MLTISSIRVKPLVPVIPLRSMSRALLLAAWLVPALLTLHHGRPPDHEVPREGHGAGVVEVEEALHADVVVELQAPPGEDPRVVGDQGAVDDQVSVRLRSAAGERVARGVRV